MNFISLRNVVSGFQLYGKLYDRFGVHCNELQSFLGFSLMEFYNMKHFLKLQTMN